MRIIKLPPLPRKLLKTSIMSNSEELSSSSCPPLVRCGRISSSSAKVADEAGPSTFVVPSLRDEDWSSEGSPNVRSGSNKADRVGSAVDGGADVEESNVARRITAEESSRPARKRGVRRRGPRRKATKARGEEYFQCDNTSDIYPSWCTEESIKAMRSRCGMAEEIEILLPKLHDRPWKCPDGYICLYESFFLEGGLWFPLPSLLVEYCRERRIVISQLTTKSICHIIGIIVLSFEAGLKIDNRFLQEVCQIKKTRSDRIFYVSTRSDYELITHGRGDNIKNWQRFYFFAKLDEFTSFHPPPHVHHRRWIERYGSY